jgi:hypothetical protein
MAIMKTALLEEIGTASCFSSEPVEDYVEVDDNLSRRRRGFTWIRSEVFEPCPGCQP